MKRFSKRVATGACIALASLVMVSSASAGDFTIQAVKHFSWSGWVGGSKQSTKWSATSATQSFGKVSCSRVNAGSGGGNGFTVAIYRERTLQPDVHLGTHGYTCNNTYQTTQYQPDSSGDFYFTFPTVSPVGGINGTANVYHG